MRIGAGLKIGADERGMVRCERPKNDEFLVIRNGMLNSRNSKISKVSNKKFDVFLKVIFEWKP